MSLGRGDRPVCVGKDPIRRLVTMSLGAVLHRMATVPSTNDTLRGLAKEGAPHGTVVVAGEQTTGRGTKGRGWHSPPGLGLYASFLLRFPDGGAGPALHLLPLAAGVATANAVYESTGIEVRLKWPNDLVRDGRKLGGILVESVSTASGSGFAIVGIGLNVGHREEDFPEEIRLRATSLRMLCGHALDMDGILAALCRTVDTWYNMVIRKETDSILMAFEARGAFSPGDPIRGTGRSGSWRGVYRGLDARGRLLVGRGGGTEPYSFDDILGLEGE